MAPVMHSANRAPMLVVAPIGPSKNALKNLGVAAWRGLDLDLSSRLDPNLILCRYTANILEASALNTNFLRKYFRVTT
jgi:hypothetical protein